jgi:hypothetical protein
MKILIMKVKITTPTDESMKELMVKQLKKLADYKSKGFTKEQLYKKFTKVFIDKNY